jgi:hypothetical protein
MGADVPVWTFRYDGKYWVPSRDPAADENLLRAVEILSIPFGFNTWLVQLFIDSWNETANEQSGETSVNITTAAVKRIDGGLAEIRDKYGQFRNVCIPSEEFEAMLRSLIDAIDAHSQAG